VSALARAATFLAAALVVAAACGGGGGGGSSPTQPTPGITFAGSSSGGSSIALSGNGTTTTLTLTAGANQVTALYGVGFDIVYPANLLAFTGASPGSMLAGVNTSFQAVEPTPGRVVIGYSRLGAVGGVTGGGPLVTLNFSSKGIAGSGTISFDKQHAYDSNGEAISGVTWAGGSVTIVP